MRNVASEQCQKTHEIENTSESTSKDQDERDSIRACANSASRGWRSQLGVTPHLAAANDGRVDRAGEAIAGAHTRVKRRGAGVGCLPGLQVDGRIGSSLVLRAAPCAKKHIRSWGAGVGCLPGVRVNGRVGDPRAPGRGPLRTTTRLMLGAALHTNSFSWC